MNCPHGKPYRVQCPICSVLDCDRHGRTAWSGEIVCARDLGGCGRVWKIRDDADVPPAEFGKNCVCGQLLTVDGTGRAICARCYAEQKRAQAS